MGIDTEKREASLVKIERFTGHNKGAILADIGKIREQLGINIIKKGIKYLVNNWGDLIKQKGIVWLYKLTNNCLIDCLGGSISNNDSYKFRYFTH